MHRPDADGGGADTDDAPPPLQAAPPAACLGRLAAAAGVVAPSPVKSNGSARLLGGRFAPELPAAPARTAAVGAAGAAGAGAGAGTGTMRAAGAVRAAGGPSDRLAPLLTGGSSFASAVAAASATGRHLLHPATA